MNQSDIDETYDPCRLTTLLSTEVGFGVLLWLAMAFSLLAIVLNILFARIVWRFTVLHVNLRILLVNVCATIVWMSTGRLIKSAYIFFTLFTSSDPCSYLVMSISACKAISTLSVTHPSTVLSLCALGIGLERTYGLLRYRAYHKKANRSLWLSMTILVFIIWTPAIIPQVYSSLDHHLSRNSSGSRDQTMPLCLNLLTFRRRDAHGMISAYTVAQLLSAITWILVYSLSRRLLTKISINRAQQSLAARFQLSQNFGVIRTLSPWMACHVLFHILILSLEWLVIDRRLISLDFTSKITLIYAVYMVQLTYSICFPIACVSKSIVLRKRLAKMVASLKKLIGIGARVNIIQPDTVVRVGEIEKEGATSNGFYLTEIKSISAMAAFTTPDKAGVKKRLQRIHVFSTLE